MDGEVDDAVDLSDDKLNDVKEEVKVVGECLRALLFCERIKILSMHCHPLKTDVG